ncbi:MAG: tetratricopeptide repeat protein [Tidjanibacter sp.]|nr:tetratricopeptide repeat protein [Tidjanibacter sp.]
MNKRIALCITILTLCLLSCATLPQRGGERSLMEIPEWFDSDSLRAAYLYTEGVRVAATEEDSEAALPYFEQVLRIDSTHTPTHYRLGEYFSRSDASKSLYHSRKALEGDSLNTDYLTRMGYSLIGVGELGAARTYFEKLTRLDPKNANHYRTSAALFAAEGMPHMAIATLDSAEHKFGRIKELADYKRSLLLEVGLVARAIEEAEAAIANTPFDPSNYLFLGEIYAHRQQDSLAEANLLKAEALAPGSPLVDLSLGNFYHRRGREEEFLRVTKRLFLNDEVTPEHKLRIYNEMLVEDPAFFRRNFFAVNSLASILYVKYPDHFEVAMSYARHHLRTGDVDVALDLLKKLAADPTKPADALYGVIELERYLGRRDSMMHYVDLAIARHPNDHTNYLLKSQELLANGDTQSKQEALRLSKKAIALAPDSLSKSAAYTLMADQLVPHRRAWQNYRNALKFNPNNSAALNNWAYFSSLNGGPLDKALEWSTRACELEPSNPTYLDTKAWILYLKGDIAEAKRVMRMAVTLDKSGDSTLLLHYADILAAEGDAIMAEIYYNRALEAGESPTLIEERLTKLKNKESNN